MFQQQSRRPWPQREQDTGRSPFAPRPFAPARTAPASPLLRTRPASPAGPPLVQRKIQKMTDPDGDVWYFDDEDPQQITWETPEDAEHYASINRETWEEERVTFSETELAQLKAAFAHAFMLLTENDPIALTSPLDGATLLLHLVQGHASKAMNPYTQESGMVLFNLAQNIVGHAESYSKVRELLTNLKRAGLGDEELLRMLISTSRDQFDYLFERAMDRLYGGGSTSPMALEDVEPPTKIHVKVGQGREEVRQLKEQVWMLVQLWSLEAARRRSAGALNAVNAMVALESGSPNVNDVLVTENLMSGEDASAKSKQNNPGKWQRLLKARKAINRLLAAPVRNLALIQLKRRIRAFLLAMMEAEAFGPAAKAWSALITNPKALPRGMSQSLEDDENVQALLDSEVFGDMVKAFRAFMAAYYDDAHPIAEQTSDLPVFTGAGAPIKDPFLIWLIDKAASEGHADVLDQVDLDARPAQDEDDEKEREAGTSGPVLGLLAGNADSRRATTVRHVAALRGLYEQSDQMEILRGLRVNTSAHSRHVELTFDKYVDSIPEIENLLELFDDPGQGLQVITAAVGARSLDELRSLLAPVEERLEAFEKVYKDRVAALDERAATSEARLACTVATQNPKPAKSEVLRYLAAQDLVLGVRTSPHRLRMALDRLRGLWRVYNVVEVVRDPGAGGINLLTRSEGLTAEGHQLTIDEIFRVYNIMSPEDVNSDLSIKQAQMALTARGVSFLGPVSREIKRLLRVILHPHMTAEEKRTARISLVLTLQKFFLDVLDDADVDEPVAEDDEEEQTEESPVVTEVWLHQQFTLGAASGLGNNCLIHTLLQLAARGEVAYTGALDEGAVGEVRQQLVTLGLAVRGEMLDFYGAAGQALLDHFMANYRFRVQVLQVTNSGRIIRHPVRGDQGPILSILHRSLHFQPLWRR